jgi:glycerol-3-phosphate acyltransferase PlsY
MLQTLVLAFAAYALGCFATGYYLVRFLTGRDIRAFHSRSAGARNAGRILGWKGFLATFAGDALKGASIIWLARACHTDPRVLPWLAPLVVAGHIWPAQLGCKGGKGLATALGAMLALDIRFALAGLVLYFLPRLHPRGHILSGIAPMVLLPFLPFPAWSPSQVTALCLASAFVLSAHRRNLGPEQASAPRPSPGIPATASPAREPRAASLAGRSRPGRFTEPETWE